MLLHAAEGNGIRANSERTGKNRDAMVGPLKMNNDCGPVQHSINR